MAQTSLTQMVMAGRTRSTSTSMEMATVMTQMEPMAMTVLRSAVIHLREGPSGAWIPTSMDGLISSTLFPMR